MTLRKITIDNTVRYIPKSEHMSENKKKQFLVNKTKKFHKTIKKFPNNISAS